MVNVDSKELRYERVDLFGFFRDWTVGGGVL